MDFRPRKSKKALIINVTSLIDVMFLLLIFFMVSSTFKNQPAINLTLPRSATAEETPVTPAVIYLTAAGAVYLNDQPVTAGELDRVLADLRSGGGEDDRIVLRADADAAHGDVVDIIDTVKESGFTRVSISARQADGRGAAASTEQEGP